MQQPQNDKSTNYLANLSKKSEGNESRFYTKVKRESERAICLNCKFPDGKERAFGYSYISGFSFDPSEGIEITTTEVTITIRGRNLNNLYENLLRHKVNMICSFNDEFSEENSSEEKSLFISNIEIED